VARDYLLLREDGRIVTTAADRLKVHRRSLRLDGLEYTVLSPRPSETARFATHRYHETWHIVSDGASAQLLARLCWAMAFQQRERTFVLIDPPLLAPNPFDADPATPIVIANNDLGPIGREAMKALRSKVPFETASMGTVVLQTRGLDLAMDDTAAFHRRDDQAMWRNEHQKRRWIDGTSGFLLMAAPPPVLRGWGVDLLTLGREIKPGMAWEAYLDYPEKSGEVQVIGDFTTQVDAAIAMRNQLFPGRADDLLSEDERARIWSARKAEA
jgi:hypothetical protein